MDLRPLGNTNLRVSPLGLGTVKLGRNRAVKYPKPFDLPSDDDARALLRLAADLGINLLDTAPAYGTSEARLGSLLADFPNHFLLSTKVGEEFENNPHSPQGPRSRFDFSPTHTRESIDRSLTRLRRDTLDIVLVHSDGKADDIPALEALHALADLKREGKARAIGFSPKTIAGARAALPLADVLMLTLNPAEPKMLPVVHEAHALGVGVLIKKALASGHLPRRLNGWPRTSGAGSEQSTTDTRDPIELALRFLLTTPGVSSIVVGTINPDHLRQNVAAVERVLGM